MKMSEKRKPPPVSPSKGHLLEKKPKKKKKPLVKKQSHRIDHLVYGAPSFCGANAGALVIESKEIEGVVKLLKANGWYPETYREPPCRRTRILETNFIQGRFGNPPAISPLASGKSARALPVIEPGSTILASFNMSRDFQLVGGQKIPPELLALLRDGRAAWRPEIRIPTAQDIALAKLASPANSVSKSSYVSQLPHKDPNSGSCFRFIELFAGIGGFRIGLESAGGQCVFASEIEERARAIYELNFEDTKTVDVSKNIEKNSKEHQSCVFAGDIYSVDAADIPEHDLLCGGFPCQVRVAT